MKFSLCGIVSVKLSCYSIPLGKDIIINKRVLFPILAGYIRYGAILCRYQALSCSTVFGRNASQV